MGWLPPVLAAFLADETPVQFIEGLSGWTAAAMLGATLGWLMFVYLPAKDKQLTALFELHVRTEGERRADFKDTMRSLIRAFLEHRMDGPQPPEGR